MDPTGSNTCAAPVADAIVYRTKFIIMGRKNMDTKNTDGTVIFIDEDTIDFEELIAEEEDDEQLSGDNQ